MPSCVAKIEIIKQQQKNTRSLSSRMAVLDFSAGTRVESPSWEWPFQSFASGAVASASSYKVAFIYEN